MFGWLPVSQANRRGFWSLLNSSSGKWVRRVLTGEELYRSKAPFQQSFLVMPFISVSQWIWEIDCKLLNLNILGCFARSCPKCCVCVQCPNQCSHYYKDSYRKKNWASLPQEQITSSKYIILCSCISSLRFLWYSSTISRRKQTSFAHMKGYPIYNKILTLQNTKNATITIIPKCLPHSYRCIIKLHTILKLLQKYRLFHWKVSPSVFWVFNTK